MSDTRNGPPKSEGRPPQPPIASPKTTSTCNDTPSAFDDLATHRLRRESAVRLTGTDPDPLHPGRQYHRPPTGFRAAGYRDGYAAAIRYVLREFGSHLDEIVRAKLAAIVSRSEAND
jgi:hypothetical protein